MCCEVLGEIEQPETLMADPDGGTAEDTEEKKLHGQSHGPHDRARPTSCISVYPPLAPLDTLGVRVPLGFATSRGPGAD